MILRTTIYSYMDKSRIYGEAGEEVKLIADYGNVLIVEGVRERFPVSVLLISNEPTKIEHTNPIVNQPPVRKQKSKAPAVKSTNELF